MRIRKAVIPAAGLGTRFLPATKSQPKEMLPLVDKPAIQYVVEEAVRSGIDDILIVTSYSKRSIEDHFDRSRDLEDYLHDAGKDALAEEVQSISELADIHYIRQKEPSGLGHAVTVAAKHVGREPFVVLLGDDLVDDESTLLTDMLDAFEQYGRSVIAVQEVPVEWLSEHGCITPEQPDARFTRITNIIEKPDPETAPSNLAVIGRYIFTPEIFDALEATEPDEGGEIQLTDAIAKLAEFQTVYAFRNSAPRYDIGDTLEYLKATVELAARRGDLGGTFRDFLGQFCKEQGIS